MGWHEGLRGALLGEAPDYPKRSGLATRLVSASQGDEDKGQKGQKTRRDDIGGPSRRLDRAAGFFITTIACGAHVG